MPGFPFEREAYDRRFIMGSGDIKLAYMLATEDVLSTKVLGFHGDIHRSASLLKSLGFDGMELTSADPKKIDWKKVKSAAEDNGLEIPMLCSGEVFGQEKLGLANPRPAERKTAMDRMKEMVDFASFLGSMLNVGRSRWYFEEGTDRKETEKIAEEAFGELSEYAAPRSVVIILEPIANHVCNFINTTREGLIWLKRVNRPNFKMMVDMYHMNIEDELPIPEGIKEAVGLDALRYVHLCDSNRKTPGHGHIDFKSVIDALKESGYKGFVSGEVSNYPDQETALRTFVGAIKPLL